MINKKYYNVKQTVEGTGKHVNSLYELTQQSKENWDNDKKAIIPKPTFIEGSKGMHWTKVEVEKIRKVLCNPIKFRENNQSYSKMKNKNKVLENEVKELKRKIRELEGELNE